ncbi:hypothetical protein GGR54DRAFT_651942 [Hypoxylon sp. NC1633]|nr:hypothetical protein GGR54DRAFT_651942 [Hypoxylon sp. NC1633]
MDGEELASGIAFMVFSQAIGPAIANTLYNVIFLLSLPEIAKYAPHLNVQAIIDAGASGFRPVVSPADLDCPMQRWHDLRKKEVEDTEAKTDRTDADRPVEEFKEAT